MNARNNRAASSSGSASRHGQTLRYTMKMGNDDDSHDESYHNNYYQRLESPCPGLESEQSDEFVGNFQLKEISPRQEQGKYQASMNDDFGHFSGTSSSENDESLDAFFHLSAPMSFYDQGNQDGHDDSHPRPASASSIASSLVQRASSVLQETSFVVQEVIKHGTICGGAVSGEQSNRDATSPCKLFDVTPSFHGRKTRTCKNMSGSSDGGDGMSAVGNCGGDGNDNDDCPLVSTAAIPLRYSQSSPCSQQCFLEDSFDKPTSFKRSISTPPAFLQSRRGSAFGRVTSASKSSGDSPLLMETHRSLSSAFDPVGVDCQKSSLSCAKKLGNEGSDEGSIAGSVAGSTFSAKAQRKIKERRRNRLGKVAGGVNQKASMNCSAVDKGKTSDCEKDGHSKVVTDCESLLKSESVQNEPKETSKVSKMQDISQADYQHFDGIESAGGRKVQSKFEVDDENSLTGGMFGQEHSPSTSPVPLPVYHKMDDNTIMPQPRLVLPTASAGVTFGTRSPCSQESSSLSKSTTKSGHSWNTLNHTQATFHSGCNTSISENVCASSNRSVTSSVAEADREVKEANRRQLRRLKMDEHDCTMSIHSMQSSDTTSTNPHAYFALTSNSAHLREGASMPVDRFFARNAVHSRGHVSHHLSLGSTTGSSSGSGRPRAINPKSPANTVSSTSVGHSISSGEDAQPPLIIKAKFGSGKKVGIAPISDDIGYSRLGSDSVIGASSNSSKSSSSKSSSSKTHRKDRTNLYQKMRASTPSPGPLSNSPYTASPVKMPMTPKSPRQFLSTAEHSNLQRPHVRRSLPLYGNQPRSNSNKFHLVSPMPDDDNPRDTLYGSSMLPQHGAFRPMSIYPSVTPERKTEEFLPSRRASA